MIRHASTLAARWNCRRLVWVSHDTRFLAIVVRGIRERNSVPVMAQKSGSPPIRIEVVGAGADHVNSATAGLCATPPGGHYVGRASDTGTGGLLANQRCHLSHAFLRR